MDFDNPLSTIGVRQKRHLVFKVPRYSKFCFERECEVVDTSTSKPAETKTRLDLLFLNNGLSIIFR